MSGTSLSRAAFFWKNPSSGFYDARTKRFRKHANPWAINGVPDVLGMFLKFGRELYCFEIKSSTGELRTSQELFIKATAPFGLDVFVVRSCADVLKALEQLGLSDLVWPLGDATDLLSICESLTAYKILATQHEGFVKFDRVVQSS